MSDKTEEVISFLEIKLADLKEQNGKLRNNIRKLL
jgi:prefoldin subunit 5